MTDTINPATTGKMAIDLLNSNISSVDGVTVSNITSQDTHFNSITPISKAIALNGDMRVIQGSTIYTDNLGASVAQNLTVNNDMLVTPTNTLTATNIHVNASAVNNNINPYGMKVLLDQAIITAGQNIIVTPDNLFQVYGPIQTDTYQPLTIGGDITLATAPTAKVLVTNLQANKIVSDPGNDVIFTVDSDRYIKLSRCTADQITSTNNSLIMRNDKPSNDGQISILSDNIVIAADIVKIGVNSTAGETIIANKGIRFGTTGNALLNSYEEDAYTGTLTNSSPSTTTITFRFVKVGKMVSVTMANISAVFQLTNSSAAFSATIASKYCSSANIALIGVLSNNNNMQVIITTVGGLFIDAGGTVPINLNGAVFNGSYCI